MVDSFIYNGIDMRQHGFTLIELLIVIAIIGVLAAIALNETQNAKKRAVDSASRTATQDLLQSWISYSSDHGDFYTPANSPQTTFSTSNVGSSGGNGLVGVLIQNNELRSDYDTNNKYIAYTGDQANNNLFDSSKIGVATQLTVNGAQTGSAGVYASGQLGVFIIPPSTYLWFVATVQ